MWYSFLITTITRISYQKITNIYHPVDQCFSESFVLTTVVHMYNIHHSLYSNNNREIFYLSLYSWNINLHIYQHKNIHKKVQKCRIFYKKMLCKLASIRSYLKYLVEKCQKMKKITLFIMDVGVMEQRVTFYPPSTAT